MSIDLTPAEMNTFHRTMNLMGNCSICLGELQGIVRILPCFHKFHEKCLFSWLRFKSSCPNCRYLLKSTQETRSKFT